MAALAAAFSVPASGAVAQSQPAPASASILVLNQERLLAETEFGRRIQQELEAASAALSAENRQIEAELTQEELDLTELRATLSPEEFRTLADEFDTRVTAIRAAQDAKTRNLQSQVEAAQQLFFEQTVPILLQLIEDRQADVLLDSRTVLLSAGSVDITEAAIAAINAAIGAGGTEPLIAVPGLSGGSE